MGPDDTLHIVARSRVKPDGEMSEARLLELIELDDEEDALDFKRTYDLTTQKDRVECIKTLVCMANSGGGYVVLGMEKAPIGSATRYQVIGCPEEHLAALEVTLFNDQIERFVEEPLDAVVVVHRPIAHNRVPLPLIWVPPTATMPLGFKTHGQYTTQDHQGKKRTVPAFAPGEIWVRRGPDVLRRSDPTCDASGRIFDAPGGNSGQRICLE